MQGYSTEMIESTANKKIKKKQKPAAKKSKQIQPQSPDMYLEEDNNRHHRSKAVGKNM